jgi:hypothetical protein
MFAQEKHKPFGCTIEITRKIADTLNHAYCPSQQLIQCNIKLSDFLLEDKGKKKGEPVADLPTLI